VTKLKNNSVIEPRGTTDKPRAGSVFILLVGIVLTTGLLLIGLAPIFAASGQSKQRDLGLPELHKINLATLQPAYSCRSSEDFEKGYEETALFLSKFSREMNSPELLFDGACGAEDFLHSSDSMNLIADLGEIPLRNVSAHLAFNTRSIHSFDFYSKFAQVVKIRPKHTYAMVVNESFVRALFVFTIVRYVPNKQLDIEYAVKEYQVLSVQSESPGFDWTMENL
jgi:hypothetical protein